MRALYRTLGPRLSRDIALVCLADAVVGASFGAIAVGAGFPWWVPCLASVVVFAGASQFMLIGIVAAGGSPLAAVAAGLLVNARHFPFGMAIADVLGHSPVRRLVGSHVMIDESVAFALSQPDPDRRRAAYWVTGIGLFFSWNAAVLVGALAGQVIDDTAVYGLDAAFPAVLLALVLPSLRDPGPRRAAGAGAVIAVGAGLLLPAGLPILLSLAGLLVLVRRRPTVVTS